MDNGHFPKTIWFLWLQGKDSMPLVVNKCYESWVKHNPDWDVIFLDEQNIADYFFIKPLNITRQAFSDIIRINLLAKHGGVWVDATCFCMKPLDEWINGYMTQGFFAFERPAPDRMLSSWFIACYKNNYIINVYQKAVHAYWNENPGLTAFEDSKWRSLFKRLQRKEPKVWFTIPVTKLLRVYPYFWFHYLFEQIYLKDKAFREHWENTPKISAEIPHNLQFAGLFNPIEEKIKEEIDNKISPVYKLTWKYEPSAYKPGTILDYLIKT